MENVFFFESKRIVRPKIVLLDMDGVIADISGGFERDWESAYPDKKLTPRDERKEYFLEKMHPEYNNLIQEMFLKKGFFYNLPPIPGAIEAIGEMEEAGLDVQICTMPFPNSKFCSQEKIDWVEKHLGWNEDRVILRWDKTRELGDYLIDDKPNVTGRYKPSWEHIIYTQPYNQHIKFRRRLTWANWRERFVSYGILTD